MAVTTRQVAIEINPKVGKSGKAAIKNIRREFKNIGANLQKAFRVGKAAFAGAATIAGALTLIAKKGIDAGDALDKMSKRTGISVEFLSGLRHAAEIGGTSLGAMEKAVKKSAQSALDASDGLKTYTRLYDRLGITVKDSAGDLKEPEKLFLDTVQALSELTNETEKAAIASKLFGRAGTELLPMLQNGRRGITSLVEDSQKLGNVWTTDTAAAAALAKDEITRLWTIAGNLGNRLTVGLIPKVTEIAVKIQDWFMANKNLINTNIDVYAKAISDSMIPALKSVKEFVVTVKDWIKENPNWTKAIALLVGAQATGLIGISVSLVNIAVAAPAAIAGMSGMGASIAAAATAAAPFLAVAAAVTAVAAAGYTAGSFVGEKTGLHDYIGNTIAGYDPSGSSVTDDERSAFREKVNAHQKGQNIGDAVAQTATRAVQDVEIGIKEGIDRQNQGKLVRGV